MIEEKSDSAQLGFDLGESEADRCEVYTLDDIRSDLQEMIMQARTIDASNLWSGQEHRFQKAVFRELCRKLPEDEGRQLNFDFLSEIERIEMLLAA